MRLRPANAARAWAVFLALGVFVPSAAAAEVAGRVRNGTTGQPVAGQFVTLLALRGQMVPVRETQTDAEGRYRFVVDANPSERFLVQVPFQDVNYNQPAVFSSGERITADVEVFESGARPQDISVEAETIFLEPHSGHVRVSEFYSVQNHSTPPRTYAPEEGSFRFALPGVVGDLQVSAGRAGGMPLRQQPQPAGRENTYTISYAFQPGDAEVQVSYVVPMSGTTLDLRLPLLVAAARRHLAVPKTGVQVQATGLKPVEQTQAPQLRVYAIEAKTPGPLRLRLQVDPAALEAAEAATSETPAPSAESENPVSIVPHPVNRTQWYIVGLTLLVLLIGLYYLYSLNPALAGEPSGRAPSATDAASRQPKRRRAD